MGHTNGMEIVGIGHGTYRWIEGVAQGYLKGYSGRLINESVSKLKTELNRIPSKKWKSKGARIADRIIDDIMSGSGGLFPLKLDAPTYDLPPRLSSSRGESYILCQATPFKGSPELLFMRPPESYQPAREILPGGKILFNKDKTAGSVKVKLRIQKSVMDNPPPVNVLIAEFAENDKRLRGVAAAQNRFAKDHNDRLSEALRQVLDEKQASESHQGNVAAAYR